MSSYFAFVPFIILFIVAVGFIVFISKKNKEEFLEDIHYLADLLKGTLDIKKENYTIKGTFKNRTVKIFTKERGVKKNKSNYLHISMDCKTKLRMVLYKEYAKSRLESQINKMISVHIAETEFETFKILINKDQEHLFDKVASDKVFTEPLKMITATFQEFSIKNDITILKRLNPQDIKPKKITEIIDQLTLIANYIDEIKEDTNQDL